MGCVLFGSALEQFPQCDAQRRRGLSAISVVWAESESGPDGTVSRGNGILKIDVGGLLFVINGVFFKLTEHVCRFLFEDFNRIYLKTC